MSFTILRSPHNPLLTADDVNPSVDNFKVDGIFNCGAIRYNDEIILMCRVAESAAESGSSKISIPIMARKNGNDVIETVLLDKGNSDLDFSDSRQITLKGNVKKIVYLTSLSHLRVARSRDGVHFTLDKKPTILPNCEEERWGMEDPRITQIDDTFYINYTAVSPEGVTTSLISTKDFVRYERNGIIFLPDNKDVTIFPQKIKGKYYALNRPSPSSIGSPDIWISESPDLIHWGRHTHFCSVSETGWENGRIGGGAVPVLTEKGWLVIYHAADRNNRYCLGAMLLEAEDPRVILAKSKSPLAEPQEPYETAGFFGNVIFTCGAILDRGSLMIYYGAADDSVCRMDIELDSIFDHLGV